jgi:hypothetical protein
MGSLQNLRSSTARYAAKRESKEEMRITHVDHRPLPSGVVRVPIQMMKSRKPKVVETVRKENIFLASGLSMKPSEIIALAPMIRPITM